MREEVEMLFNLSFLLKNNKIIVKNYISDAKITCVFGNLKFPLERGYYTLDIPNTVSLKSFLTHEMRSEIFDYLTNTFKIDLNVISADDYLEYACKYEEKVYPNNYLREYKLGASIELSNNKWIKVMLTRHGDASFASYRGELKEELETIVRLMAPNTSYKVPEDAAVVNEDVTESCTVCMGSGSIVDERGEHKTCPSCLGEGVIHV